MNVKQHKRNTPARIKSGDGLWLTVIGSVTQNAYTYYTCAIVTPPIMGIPPGVTSIVQLPNDVIIVDPDHPAWVGRINTTW